MKKLPIGVQTFVEIRQDNFIYVDKTKEAYELITNYKYAFLSRPRRFGKSLFVDTLRCIFEGRKELFEGLYIYDKWDWEDRYPVIHISFAGDLKTSETLKEYIISRLTKNQKRLGLNYVENDTNYSIYFKNLIEQAYEKYQKRIVILIDEYDKPILDNIEELDICKQNREILKSLYSIIKDSDEYIKFVFLTGVSKFSKTSIFSGLNILEDITISPIFGNICGYTQEDIDTVFKEYLEGVDKEEVKRWYNGYYWLKDRVYNPFDILKFIKEGYEFKNYWFETGTPTFLIKLLEERYYYIPELENLVVDNSMFDSFDIETMEIEPILFQAGYLTIDRVELLGNQPIYYLRVPNLEVASSFNDKILGIYQKKSAKKKQIQIESKRLLLEGEIEQLRKKIENIFSSIPYSNYRKNEIEEYEGFYASVVYTYFYSLGFEVIAEDITNVGSIDLTMKVNNRTYIFEFKVDEEDALSQIKAKRYYEKYIEISEEIYIVGIVFDSKIRNISKYEWERIK